MPARQLNVGVASLGRMGARHAYNVSVLSPSSTASFVLQTADLRSYSGWIADGL